MNPQDYWQAKHPDYSSKDWIKKPTIFATQVLKYFPPAGKILELGAGQGQDSVYFADHSYEILATDFSQYALDQITDVRVKKQFVDLSQPLPFSPNSFDIVYSHLALHYFDQKRTRELFDEIYDILKPGGIFATLTNTIEDPEVFQATKVEDEFYNSGGIQKRFFSVDSMAKLTSKFKILLLDNHGKTHKDEIKTLIRFVGQKQ